MPSLATIQRASKKALKEIELEANIRQRRESGESAAILPVYPIPDSWVEFAESISIRSGIRFTKFSPYFYQKNIIEQLAERSATITKGRQLGASIVLINWMLWRVLKDGLVTLGTSRTGEDAFELSKKVRSQINYLPPEWGVKLTTDNLSELAFSNGGRMLFRAPTDDCGRGVDSCAIVLIDEAQSLINLDILQGALSATQDACGDDARMIICGTPPENRFYPFWQRLTDRNGDIDFDSVCQQIREGEIPDGYKCWLDEDGWAKIVFDYHAHPVHKQNPNYIEDVIRKKKITRSMAMREYALLVPTEDEAAIFEFSLVRQATRGEWEKPDPAGIYYMGIDSSGEGDDYTVGLIFRKLGDRFHCVHMFRRRKETTDFMMAKLADLIEAYNPSAVMVESNAMGICFYDNLAKTFPNIPMEKAKTTAHSKPGFISNLILALERGEISFPQSPIPDEFLSFRRMEGKLMAAPGKHDDCVMAAAFVFQVSEYDRHTFGRDALETP